ncbi:hypothetical protein V6S65_12565 [Lactococcus lactis]|uniref:hypothetical protein n=1 Tax=Lactococcus lactis TaxID=1358 RepID=UPI001F0DD320|nr:hypothetical protein [Lactococcus lactis]MCH5354517.1 hypothetical protein [Lactococcus lactis]
MVLKLLAIFPSGSAGKFLKKIWNLEKWGGYYDPEFSEEKLLTFDLNDNIFGEDEIKVIPISKTKIVNTIDEVMNEIAKEIVLKYNQDMFKVTSKLGEISLTPIQEKFDKLKDI